MIGEALMVGGFVVVAWAGHNDESRRLARVIELALDDAYALQRHASIDMGLDPHGTELSKQLAGRPMNIWRLWGNLSPAFRLAFLKHLARDMGATVITAEDQAFILGLGFRIRKRMAHIAPDLFQRKAM